MHAHYIRTYSVISTAYDRAEQTARTLSAGGECGLATDDPGLLDDHLNQHGHRERVPWWDKLTQVIPANW